jgi:hypothetical protein
MASIIISWIKSKIHSLNLLRNKKLFCKHKDQEHIRNIYGDEINISNGNRSWWRCQYCNKLILSPNLLNSLGNNIMLKLYVRKNKAKLEHIEKEEKINLDKSKVNALERMVSILERIDINTNNPLTVSPEIVKKIAKQTSEEIGFIPSINNIDVSNNVKSKKKTSKKRNISRTAKKLEETK